ncbi:MAG: IstB-like ATP-binding domain-containing protein [Alphaproteobacteria bacterium]|nr:IstB-like ATP-binding domain-containing protein [Alphaproteobacteria bacterium]
MPFEGRLSLLIDREVDERRSRPATRFTNKCRRGSGEPRP